MGMAETLAGWDAPVCHSCSSAGVPFALCAWAFLVVDPEESSFQLSELLVPDSISAQPPNHRHCCSFKAPAEQQQLLGLQLNSTSHEMRDSKKSTEREKAEASETIRHLKAVWDSRRGKKEKESLTVLSRGAQRGLCCSFTRCCSTDTLQTWAHLHLRSTFQCLKLLILLNSQTPNEPHPKGSCQAILAHLTD